MKLVVNTNRIIAALIKDSASRKIINHLKAELISIEFSDIEIKKYKQTILKKASINEEEFKLIFEKIREKLVVLDDNIILTKLDMAKEIMDKIDPDDTPFIAAALATNADIWSDDQHFQKQNKIKIWKTEDLTGLV